MKITIEAQTFHDKDAPRSNATGEREAMRWLVQALNDNIMSFSLEAPSSAPVRLTYRGINVTIAFDHKEKDVEETPEDRRNDQIFDGGRDARGLRNK